MFFESAPFLYMYRGKKNVENCVSRYNTNFDANIKQSDRAHSKNKNMCFYIIF